MLIPTAGSGPRLRPRAACGFDMPDEATKTMRETPVGHPGRPHRGDGRLHVAPAAQGLPVDHRSDIFTLAILLYEMATGEPFRGNTTCRALVDPQGHAGPASELRDEVRSRSPGMIQPRLEKRPEDRYQSATDLRPRPRGPQAGRRHRRGRPPTTRAPPDRGAATSRRRWRFRRDRRGPRASSGRWPRSSSAASRRPRPGRPPGPCRLLLRQPLRDRELDGCAPASPTCW